VDELFKTAAVWRNDTERCVLGADELASGFGDAQEYGSELEVTYDRQVRLDESAETPLSLQRLLRSVDELRQQVIQAKLRDLIATVRHS
jgi:hypothetical protein